MRILRGIILILTVAGSAVGGVRGAAWDTLCIGFEGGIQLKPADAACCQPAHEAADSGPAGWLTDLAEVGGHECIDIPLPPIRLERPANELAAVVLADAAVPASVDMLVLPDLSLHAATDGLDAGVGASFQFCSTTVLRC